VSVGDTLEEVRHEIQEAIRFHIDGLLEDNLPVPDPTSVAITLRLNRKSAARLRALERLDR